MGTSMSTTTPPQPPLTEAEIGNVLLTLLTYVGRDARLLERVICQLRRERDEAREALKPFADASEEFFANFPALLHEPKASVVIDANVGDLILARKAAST
jgi:hypothetical protein